jgi:hypothetical protein
MSAETWAWCWAHSPFSGTKLIVHLALADIANDAHGYELWVSTEAIANRARCNRGTARRALLELIEGGFLEVLEDRSASNRSSKYRFLQPEVGRAFHATGQSDPGEAVAQSTRPSRNPRDPVVQSTRHNYKEQQEELQERGSEQSSDASHLSLVVAEVDEPTRLANLLADLIAADGSKRPNVTATWVTDMDRFLRLDEKSPADIERYMRWLFQSRDEIASFWAPNIRSPKKLREKYDTIRAQVNRRPGRTRGTTLNERLESKAAVVNELLGHSTTETGTK